jgi:tripeptidyl-peptidase-1
MRFTLIALATLVASVAAIPHPSTHVVHEKRDATPKQWVKRAKLDSRAKLPMRVGLQQRNLEKGHDLLMEV